MHATRNYQDLGVTTFKKSSDFTKVSRYKNDKQENSSKEHIWAFFRKEYILTRWAKNSHDNVLNSLNNKRWWILINFEKGVFVRPNFFLLVFVRILEANKVRKIDKM